MTSDTYPRVPAVDGDEVDVTGSWRHVHAWCDRPGSTSAVKRRMRRRERRLAKLHIQEWVEAE